VGDIDGDLDLDLLHGARQDFLPRMFGNRLEESGGVLTFFRDVTTASFPARPRPAGVATTGRRWGTWTTTATSTSTA
jgi:hypothetical protein